MKSLQHDHAWAIAVSITEVFAPLLRDEEKRDAFVEVYERIKAGIEHFTENRPHAQASAAQQELRAT